MIGIKMRKQVLKLIQKYFLKVDTDIRVGDLVRMRDNETVIFEAVGIYYNYELKPFLFIQDRNGYIFGKPVFEFVRITDPRIIENANY